MNRKQGDQCNWKLYGALVKKARKKAGYDRADYFAASIYRRSRIRISRDTMYKIEQGRQAPSVMQLQAINLTLFGSVLPAEVIQCFPKHLKKLIKEKEKENV